MAEFKKVKVYTHDTLIDDMRDINGESGYELTDIINDDSYYSTVIEELHTSNNFIQIYYPIDGANRDLLVNGSHILYPTQKGYNLYTITNIFGGTDGSILEIEAQQYTINFMRDDASDIFKRHAITSFSEIQSLVNKKGINLYLNGEIPDVEVEGEGKPEVIAKTTLGSLLVGANSIIRRTMGLYIRREFDSISAFNPTEVFQTTNYPLTLGVNIDELDYEIDTGGIVKTAMVDIGNVPSIKIKGQGKQARFTGVGGLRFNSLSEITEGNEYHFAYKGVPLMFKKTGGVIKVSFSVQDDGEDDSQLLKNHTVTYTNGVIEVKYQNEVIFSEILDESELYALHMQSSNVADYQTDYGFNVNEISDERVEDGTTYKLYTEIPEYLFNLSVKTPYETQVKGNPIHYVQYSDDEKSVGDGPNSRFLHWYMSNLGNFWADESSKRLTEPDFKAVLSIDDLTNIYGRDFMSSHIFEIGQTYQVYAEKYNLEFESVLTKTIFNGVTGELIEVEFSNTEDLELEAVRRVDKLSTIERGVSKPKNTNTDRTTSKPQGNGNNNNTDPDDDTPDLSMTVNDLTDDGPERIEWENPLLYIAPKSTRTSQLKLNWYNRTRDVALPKLVDFYNVRLSAVLSSEWNHLAPKPTYTGNPSTDRILPYMPKPARSTVSGNTYEYKAINNNTGISNNYDLPQSYYNNSTISAQMSYEEWLNIYKTDDYKGRWYFFHEHIDGAFINRYDLKEIHNILFDTVYDDQLAPFIRLIYPDEFEGIKSSIIGKTVKELYEESEGYKSGPIDKNYLIKRLKYVVASSAERAIRYNLNGVDYRKVDSQDPSVPPVKVNHRMYVPRTALAGTNRYFHSECEIAFNPITDASGVVQYHLPASDLSTVKITKLFHDSESLVKYAHQNFVEPGGAIYARLEIPQYPDLPVEPVIVVAHGTIGMEIRSKINDLNKLYATLTDDDRKRFEAQHGTYASNYYKALVDEGQITYGQSIVLKPEDLVEQYDRVHNQMDRYWEKVYSELISKGKIDADTIYEETE